MKKKLIAFFLVAISIVSFSENIKINLNDAVETAKKTDEEIKQAEITAENYELQRKQAFKGALPSLNYTGTYKKPEDEDTVNQYYLQLSQTLFNGFKTVTAIKTAEEYVEKGILSLESKKNEIGLEAMEYYIALDKYNKELQILEKSKTILETKYKKTNEKYNLGLVTKSEVLQISYSLTEIDSEIIQLNNNIETTKMNLKNLLGITDENSIEIAEIEIKDFNIDNINLQSDLQKALDSSLTMKIQKIETKVTEKGEVTARADFMPKVSLNMNYGNISSVTGNVADAFKNDNMSWAIGVSVSGTLFNFGETADAYKEAKNNTKYAKYEEKSKKEDLKIEIKSQYLELIRLKKLEAANEKALASSKENYQLQEQSYENSLISSTDFLEAENDMREAEINLIEAKLDLYYAYEKYKNLLK